MAPSNGSWPETAALVFCDEAYQEFGGPSALALPERNARVIVFRTFSKAMGMAGLRFGYALAHPEVAREIAKGKLPYNVNAITLAAAEVALGQPDRFAARVREIIAERERLIGRLAALPGVEAFPSAANFVLIRFASVPAETVFRRLIEEHQILIRDVSRGAGLAAVPAGDGGHRRGQHGGGSGAPGHPGLRPPVTGAVP